MRQIEPSPKRAREMAASTIPSSAKAVVFGATGAIGTALIQILSNDHPSWTIQAVTRRDISKPSGTSSSELLKLPNVEFIQGDPLNRENVLTLTDDCDVMYSCVGFAKYARNYWAKNWPIVASNLLSAAVASSDDDGMNKKKRVRRLVFCDNLYALGPGCNRSPTTTKPVTAGDHSKPAVRAKLRQQFMDHMKAYPGTLVVVGGSDICGPHVTKNSMIGDMFTGAVVDAALSAKKQPTATIAGACDKIHDCCYVRDFAHALATASIHEEAYDSFWICPHSIKNKTLRQVANDIADIAYNGGGSDGHHEHEPAKISVIGTFLMYLLSPFVPFLGEMIEMKDFFQQDYTVDDTDFCTKFGVTATPYHETLAAYVDFYKTHREMPAKAV